MMNGVPNAQALYTAAAQMAVGIMNQNNIPMPVRQVIAGTIDVAQNQQSGTQWLQNIINVLQSNGINVAMGVQEQQLYQVVYNWLQQAIPQAIQFVQQQQQQQQMGGGLMGMGGMIGGSGMIGGGGGFDYTPVNGGPQQQQQGAAIGGAPDPYDSAGIPGHSNPAQPTQAQQQPAADKLEPVPEIQKINGSKVSESMSLQGTEDSLIRSDNLDFVDISSASKENYSDRCCDDTKSLQRAGFGEVPVIMSEGDDPGETPPQTADGSYLSKYQQGVIKQLQVNRRGLYSCKSNKWDVVTACNLNARRAYNTPLELLKDFFGNSPNEFISGLWAYRIFYRQLDVLPVPTRMYTDLQAKIGAGIANRTDANVWRDVLNVLHESPQVAFSAVDDFVTPRMNSYLNRFMRSPISIGKRLKLTTIKDLKQVMSATFKARFTEDPEWNQALNSGVTSEFVSMFGPDAMIGEDSPNILDLARCTGISLGSRWDDPASFLMSAVPRGSATHERAEYVEGDNGKLEAESFQDLMIRLRKERTDGIREALENVTVISRLRSVVLTNTLPKGYCRRMNKMAPNGENDAEEALFWKVMNELIDDPSTPFPNRHSDYVDNELVFNIPFRCAPSESMYGFQFARPLSTTKYELVSTTKDINAMIWQ